MSAAIVAAIAVLAIASPAMAQRPALTGEKTFGVTGGDILVHYATTGADAVQPTDRDTNGVPDFVDEVATTAEQALDHFLELGFRRPLDDGTLGGDGRIDIYLRNLNASDGNAGSDSCTGKHCVGFIAAENDYAGYSYSSITEGIRSVVPHELFHLVQNAYASDEPSIWTEGSAVWAVENLYGDGNSDFERFLPSFVTKSFRPFERGISGFGDGYPYGAALWPYFLEHRFGVDLVVDTWAGCETASFLDAAGTRLATADGSLDDAWVDFTRWNLFTGAAAARGPYPAAATWPSVPREPAIADHGTLYIEGLSARYVPITVAARARITLSTAAPLKLAGWLVADGASFDDGIPLEPDDATHAANVDPGSYTLVVTGLARNSIATAVDVTLGPPASSGGGCSSTTPASSLLLAITAFLLRRRSRTFGRGGLSRFRSPVPRCR